MKDRDKAVSGRSGKEERREIRRRRRIQSQITAYIIAGAVLITGVGIVGLGIGKIGVEIQKKSAAALASFEEAEVVAEPTAVSSPTDSAETEVMSTDDMLNNIVDTCLSEMPIEDKVAGLFMISPEQLTGADAVIKAGTATQEALSNRAVGGIMYTSRNAKESEQLKEMIESTVSMSKYPLFIAASEVGGDGSHIASALNLEIPASPAEIAATGDAENAYNTASTIADYLYTYGFNLDMGVNANLSDNDWSFGTDPEIVSSMIGQTVSGLQSYGVSACLQYFPMTSDSGQNPEEMADALSPFRAGIDAGASMIMVCTAPSSGITGDSTPSCLSSAVMQDVLRTQLGFDGIIITDTLSDLENYSSADSAVNAILAGADMINHPMDFEEAYQGVLAAVQNGTISEDRITESLRRIYKVKYADRVETISEED